jgi:D-alanyl-D-alanine carboxypeptidase
VGQIQLVAAENVWAAVIKGKENTISTTKILPKYLVAPIKKDQVVGKLQIQGEGKVLKEIDLLTSSDVPQGVPFLWLLFGGGIMGLLLVGLIAFLRIRRNQRKKF